MILDEIFKWEESSKEGSNSDDEALFLLTENITNVKNELTTENLINHSQNDENHTDFDNLKKENEILKSNLTCKICLDEPVGELFLPCRHLVCCVQCSKSVDNCPLCRAKIVGTIKTFI